MLILNTDIFLKRVRELLYESFFEMNKGSYRVKGSRVYDLAYSNDINRKIWYEELQPSPEMQRVAEVAYTMGTTLWFDKDEKTPTYQQECLIACGHFTTCYNLLSYIKNLEASKKGEKFDEPYQKRIETLKAQLEKHYKKFQEDPFFLYNELGEALGSEFKPMNADLIPFPKNFDGVML